MEYALVGLIVAGALLFMVRRARKALAPDQGACTAGCGCGSSCRAFRDCACAGQNAVRTAPMQPATGPVDRARPVPLAIGPRQDGHGPRQDSHGPSQDGHGPSGPDRCPSTWASQ